MMTMEGQTDLTFEEVPKGKRAMAVMGKEGDTKYIWDADVPAEVEGARRHFEFMTKEKKYAAFKLVGSDGRGEQIRAFNPEDERVIFVPPMQGG
jgi:hypothetical protein